MRRTKLTLSELEVQSFTTTHLPSGLRGTVHGAQTLDGTCGKSCEWGSCDAGCSAGGTCDAPGACGDTDLSCNFNTCAGPYGNCAQDEG